MLKKKKKKSMLSFTGKFKYLSDDLLDPIIVIGNIITACGREVL